MVHSRRSSARISASRVLPKLVRSPHKASTSASCAISANISRKRCSLASVTWRSPIAASVIGPPLAAGSSRVPFMLLFDSLADDVSEAPFRDIDDIVARGQQPAAADPRLRGGHLCLGVEPLHQLVEQPAGDALALGRVDEAEV